MSKDFKIEKICDHKIIQEQVYIDSDLKTIHIPRTLASTTVELWVNGFKIEAFNQKFGWNIQEDETAVFTKKSKLVFNYKRKATDDFFHISYSVKTDCCPKCQGKGLINDFSYSSLGKPVMVENEEKLLQEIKKGLATYLGSNPFHTWIGTEIPKLIGAKVTNVDLIKARIIQEINKYIQKYKNIQIQQAYYQEVTLREAFDSLLQVNVDPQIEVDISYWIISIIFRNKTGDEMLYEKQVVVPNTGLLYNKKNNIS